METDDKEDDDDEEEEEEEVEVAWVKWYGDNQLSQVSTLLYQNVGWNRESHFISFVLEFDRVLSVALRDQTFCTKQFKILSLFVLSFFLFF